MANVAELLDASFPDKVLAVKLETTAPAGLNLTVKLARGQDATTTTDGDHLHLSGRPKPFGTQFSARLVCTNDGGSVTATDDGYKVTGAKSVVLLLTAATDLLSPDAESQSLQALAAARST